ncbi:hypothetical protein Taro_040590, partial [Colocasia esculenta]|nr:hypothetical protein [Colocasia esculenta]
MGSHMVDELVVSQAMTSHTPMGRDQSDERPRVIELGLEAFLVSLSLALLLLPLLGLALHAEHPAVVWHNLGSDARGPQNNCLLTRCHWTL